MTHPDEAAVQALRSDLALQIARHVGRDGLTQVAAARRLAIPQPTLSKIMRGQVQAVSLELLLKVATRAGLSVVLQTGRDAAEAGVYGLRRADRQTRAHRVPPVRRSAPCGE
ncbi:MAG: XRE family transcriptional regulator [Rhodobacteraceae bacterium]|nr:XRE family transcriptional regulator [Paracoccaceae bacterium]